MITVSKERFYQLIGKLNVHPRPIGSYPYKTHWKLRDGSLIGLDDGNEYKILKELAYQIDNQRGRNHAKQNLFF